MAWYKDFVMWDPEVNAKVWKNGKAYPDVIKKGLDQKVLGESRLLDDVLYYLDVDNNSMWKEIKEGDYIVETMSGKIRVMHDVPPYIPDDVTSFETYTSPAIVTYDPNDVQKTCKDCYWSEPMEELTKLKCTKFSVAVNPTSVACATEFKSKDNTQTAKADAGKPKLSLVPSQIIYDIAEVREYGNRKYGDPDNWKTVEKERYRDAAYRHFLAYLKDPDGVDEESSIKHLKHLACNIAFLCEMEEEE